MMLQFFSVFILALSLNLKAELPNFVYPSKTPLRLEGLDQQNVGSCMAEAETNAVEHFLTEKGFRVRLSTFYKHARIWAKGNKPAPEQGLTSEDRAYLRRLPHIVPLFMYPEDSQGFMRVKGRIRPPVKDMLVLDDDYPRDPKAFQYKSKSFTFKTKKSGKWANYINFSEIKNKIYQRKALTLEVHSALLLKYFDDYTGLLNKNYSYSDLMKNLDNETKAKKDRLTHSVAIVGYDDKLYEGSQFVDRPGAIIIANSWNSYVDLKSTQEPPTSEQKDELNEMRYKVYSKRNLPAYYAIPYEYIKDLFEAPTDFSGSKKGEGSLQEYSFNYLEFVRKVGELSFNYKTYYVPYSCNRKRFDVIVLRSIRKLFSSQRPSIEKTFDAYELATINTKRSELGHSRKRYFQFAKLPYNKVSGENRLEDFLSGKFNSYYCFDKNPEHYSEIFPNKDDLKANSSLYNLIYGSISRPDEMLIYELLFNLSH